MLDNSFSYFSNDNCSKKELCLRYTNRRNVVYGQTYLSLSEEQCDKDKCYINKDEYYMKMLKDIIVREPQDDLDRKLLLESCYSLLKLSEQYNLKSKLEDKIKSLEDKT